MDRNIPKNNSAMSCMDTGIYLLDNDPITTLQNNHKVSAKGLSEMNNTYIGKDRRLQERRVNASERRELVRYEINKIPRRSGNDRRKVNGWAEYSEYTLM